MPLMPAILLVTLSLWTTTGVAQVQQPSSVAEYVAVAMPSPTTAQPDSPQASAQHGTARMFWSDLVV